MEKKTKRISDNRVASLRGLFDSYVKLQKRVDAVNSDLKRFHTRITTVMLRVLEERKRV